MANRDYWQKRFVLLEEAQINKGTAYYHELEKQYRKAAGEIEKELSKWYARLAVNNELSITEAKKLLDRDELQEFHWTVEEYIEKGRTLNISDQWAKQLENASAKVHISRYEALKLQMQQQIEVLYGNELDSMDKFMRDIYTESYYRTAFEIQKGLGVGSDFMRLNDKKASQIIAKPWAADGSNFSSRIWKQKAQLVTELQNQITQDMALGRSPQESIKAIKDRFKVSSGQAGRLVMTETAFFHSAAQKDTFNKLNVEEYEIVATLDNKTSEICRNMDGKHMPMSEFKPGITAPPFHCWCRSTTVPYFDDEFTIGETRAARDEETGKSYEVPANMTYPEWKETFVDGGSKDELKVIDNNTHIAKSVEIPDDLGFIKKADTNFEGKDIDVDCIRSINNAIKKQKEKGNGFGFKEIKIGKFAPGYEKSVFITDYTSNNFTGLSSLYLNSEMFTGISKTNIEKSINALYNNNWWKSKSLEDLVNHEIMHSMINFNNSFDKANRLYEQLRVDSRVYGLCRLVDNDPTEFMNEMFVALNNGEEIPQQYIDVYNEYFDEFLR